MRKIITVAPRWIPFGLHLNLATRQALVIIPTTTKQGFFESTEAVSFGYIHSSLYNFWQQQKSWSLPPLCFNARTGSVVVFEVARRGHTQNAYYVRRQRERAILFARRSPEAEFGARLARVKAKVDAAAGEMAACN